VLDGLDELGLLDDLSTEGVRAADGLNLRVFATGEQIRWGFDVLRDLTEHPYNVHLGQDRFARIVLQHLHKHENVDVRWGTEVSGGTQDGDSVTLELSSSNGNSTISSAYVVGADGASSAVRSMFWGRDFDGMTWPDRFVATNVRYDFGSHGFGNANMQIDPVYGAVIARIDDNDLWRVTYCEDAGLPEESIIDRMPAFFDAVLPGDKEYELVHHSPYRMHQRAAGSFRKDRVVLAGDAAHVTNPTGGLGLTCGLLDAYVLHDALAAIIRGDVPADVLDAYSTERRTVFLDKASPSATNFKQLVYHSSDPAMLEQALAGMRHVAGDPDLVRAAQLDLSGLRTPSVVGRGAA
jgi:3-(3-hydroxy-phenyl)propionate hydroxylase/6-hydroxy-3-succinoylpyridine 3-monooxygenase